MTVHDQSPNTAPGCIHRLRALILAAVNLYAFGLILYLLLRLLLGDDLWWMGLINNFVPLYFLPLIVLLPLALMLRAPWVFVRLLPLVLIGVLWFGPLFLPRSVAAVAGDDLKVVTFNMLMGNDRIDDIRAWMTAQDPDLVLMQEVIPHDCCPLPEMPDDYTMILPDDFGPHGFGPAIFSRLPVADVEIFSLESTRKQIRVEVDLNGQRIAVYNMHLQLPTLRPQRNNGSITFYDESTRRRQVAALITRLENESLPYVVAGDFNLSDMSEAYAELAAVMDDSFRQTATGFGMTWPAYRDGSEQLALMTPVMRLDYVWYSAAFRAVDGYRGPFLGSDHLPVVARLVLMDL